MKSHIGREIGLLMLPALLISGVAWWNRPAPPAATVSVPISSRATLTVGTIEVLRLGPIYSQNIWRDQDCSLTIPLRADGPQSNAIMRGLGLKTLSQPSGAPFLSPPTMSPPMPSGSSESIALLQTLRFQLCGFTSENGSSLTSPPGYYNLLNSLDGGRNMQSLANLKPSQTSRASHTEFPYGLFHAFDLDRVPATLGTIRLDTAFRFPDGRVRPLSVLVRPRWFTWAPRTLHLRSIGWKAPQNGDDGSVILTVRGSGEKPLLIEDEPQGSTTTWQVRSNLDGITGSEIITEHKLLHNWSPRLESADGKYNSHAAKDAFVWAKFRGIGVTPTNPQTPVVTSNFTPPNSYLSQFRPQIQADTPLKNGALTTLRFRFFGLKSLPALVRRAPVFKTEIGVPGDGFLRVSFALPPVKTPRKPPLKR